MENMLKYAIVCTLTINLITHCSFKFYVNINYNQACKRINSI